LNILYFWFYHFAFHSFILNLEIWAASRQNQHNRFATSMDHGSMLFTVSFSTCNRVGKRTAWILIRLRGCAGWSGSMLVANPLCWFCHDTTHMCFFFNCFGTLLITVFYWKMRKWLLDPNILQALEDIRERTIWKQFYWWTPWNTNVWTYLYALIVCYIRRWYYLH
jgi:hypothetical protein